MTQPRILTVVLNYRTPDMTLRAARHALTAMQSLNGEVIVVDNASGDGSLQKMQDHAQAHGWTQGNRLRVVASDRNGGFGAGNNFGIRAGLSDGTKPDFIYILNSDAFPDPKAITRLLAALQQHPECWCAGSFIQGEDGTPHQTLFRFPSVSSELEGAIRFGPVTRLLRDKMVPLPVPSTDTFPDWMAGASVLMRQSVLDQIGLFDETFFLYFEETDLFLRAARAGHRAIYVRDSKVVHIGSVSTGMKEWSRVPGYWFDSRLYYFVKNHGLGYAIAATSTHLLGGALYWLRRQIDRKPLGVPSHFLRTMLAHDLKAFLRPFGGPRKSNPRQAVPSDRMQS